MQFQSTVTCNTCGGTGRIIKNRCKKCGGNGTVQEEKKLTVSIPAGIDDGERIALRGQGCDGRNGGPAGDLLITVMVRPSSTFRRDGYNLYCEVPLTVAEATLGAEIEVPTLEGTAKYTVPEGTQPGATFTMRGKGVPYVNSSRRGDIIFTANVKIPKGLTEKQKSAMRAFDEACGGSNAKKGKFFKK